MGRGRAKAKQTKVARELKYQTPNTDLTALQRELAGAGKSDRHFDDDNDELVDDEHAIRTLEQLHGQQPGHAQLGRDPQRHLLGARGHALVQNLRHGFSTLTDAVPRPLRLARAWPQLARAI